MMMPMKNIVAKTTAILAAGLISQISNADAFGFDRPGAGLGTDIVPKGHLAWEQSLPSASYDDYSVDGEKHSVLTVQGDMLARIGLGSDVEFRVGWDGPIWQKEKLGANSTETHGVGDVTLGIKKAINTHDDAFKWALLAQVNLANGDDEFTVDKEIYTLGSAISYQFNDSVSTGMTMYYDYQDGDLAWSAIPSLQYKIVGNLSGFSEYVYRKQESQHKESILNNGLIWSVKDNLQLDASIGYSFNRENPRLNAGLGVAYLF